MRKLIVLIVSALVALPGAAEAKHRHRGHHRHPTKQMHRPAVAETSARDCFRVFCASVDGPGAVETSEPAPRRAFDLGRANALIGPLAAKRDEIVAACGVRTGDNARHSLYVAGTRRVSLHKLGKAVDFVGNAACVYRHLVGWPGGVSTDSWIGHVHVSYEPNGREWGMRFRHRGGRHHHHRKGRRR